MPGPYVYTTYPTALNICCRKNALAAFYDNLKLYFIFFLSAAILTFAALARGKSMMRYWFKRHAQINAMYISNPEAHQNTIRRDARVVEEARLESVYICQRVSRVRIPFSPHTNNIAPEMGAIFVFGKC